MLARLKLSGIRDHLDSLLDEAARSNLSTREALAMFCEREIARKDHRRVNMAIALGREAVLAGYSVQFSTAMPRVASLAKAHSEKRSTRNCCRSTVRLVGSVCRPSETRNSRR